MRRLGSVVGLTALALLGWLGAPLAFVQAPSQERPRFRGGTDLVVVDVSVVDRDRRPVPGLTAADFVLLEDGRPQKVETFSAIELPDLDGDPEMTASWLREAAFDVVRNTDFKEHQAVVIVMDDATPMEARDVPLARRVARQIVERLGPGDMAAVVYALNKAAGQEFTADRARLIAAIDNFNGALPDSMLGYEAFDEKAMTLYGRMLATLEGVARAIGELPERRKAVFLVSVGIPLDWGLAQGQPIDLRVPGQASKSGAVADVVTAIEQMFDAARRANVNVHAFDPGGLRAPTADAVLGGTPTLNMHSGRLNQEFLESVALATGGRAVIYTNDPVPGITQALRENRSYYLLGYAPSNARADGRFRTIEVKVNRPDVTARARSGYVEPRGANAAKAATSAPSSAVDRGLANVVPKFDQLPLTVAAAPFALPGKRDARLALVLGVHHETPARATRLEESVQVRTDLYKPNGKLQTSRREKIPVTLNRVGVGAPVGYELLVPIDVPPGRYHLRASVEATLQGIQLAPSAPRVAIVRPGEDLATRTGSVYCDVDVPDFPGAALTLSGVAVAVAPAVVSGPQGRFASLLPLVPTTLRDFAADDRVSAFARVYQRISTAAEPITIDLTIRDWRDRVVAHKSEVVGADRFTRGVADYPFDVPLEKLAPGPHLLQVQATLGSRSVHRDVRFTVHSRP